MSNRFHINRLNGAISRCSAQEGNCPFGGDSGTENHFDSIADARAGYEKIMAEEIGIFNTIKKSSNATKLKSLEEKLEKSEYDSVINYADSSLKNYQVVNELIDSRIDYTRDYAKKLDDIDPYQNKDSCVSKTTFKELRRNYQSYRDQTAVLVEAAQSSKFYQSQVEDLPNPERVGLAVKATTYDHNDVNWHLSRYNTIGGSDLGAKVVKDFVKEDELTNFDKLTIQKIEQSKIVKPSIEDAQKNIQNSELSRKGALYRGTVWEDRIRDDFAKDHPELKVYKTKDQFVSPDREWQKVNFDAVLSDRKDGEPNGILEIKTGGEASKWKNGVPLNYRAQTLYYLNATGFDYANVRVLLNDSESRDYKITKNDDVYPGSGVKMDDYIKDSIIPWFNDLKSQRENG